MSTTWLVILVAVIQIARPIGDPDTFWHLAAGDRLRQTWTFNGPDPWSTMSTQPWRLHEWLPELLMSVVQQVLGLPGVAWLLFDDIADPCQRTNLADDPAGASLRAELSSRLAALLRAANDPFLPGPQLLERMGLSDAWRDRNERIYA